MVPIPETNRVRYLEENMAILHVTISASDRKNIAERLVPIPAVGKRYVPDLMALSERA